MTRKKSELNPEPKIIIDELENFYVSAGSINIILKVNNERNNIKL